MNASRLTFRGTGINTGKAIGKLRFFRRSNASQQIRNAGNRTPEKEHDRLRSAVEQTKRKIDALYQRALTDIGEQEAEIFEIHAMLLEDEDFLDTVRAGIANGKCAEEAVEEAVTVYSQMLRELNDPYLSARAADIRDIANQLISALSGEETTAGLSPSQPYILVADDLSPSETVLLDKSLILGFVTFAGTPNSHTAILARAMGIPALIGVGTIAESCDAAPALLDTGAGTLTVNPGEAERTAFEKQLKEEQAQAQERERRLKSRIHQPAVTRSGHSMLIYANIGGAGEVPEALRNGAEGIGLLRSEFLYLSMNRYPGENELFEAYRDVVAPMNGKRVVIRTLDIGADKQISYFDLPHEENPALGFRAVRICLARQEIFKTQLRAILRASAFGKAAVMIPMIVSLQEIRQCRQLLEECKAELTREGVDFDKQIEFGIMVETPAAAVMSAELASEVDFFSVGTNDLIQYTLAADRQNPTLAELCDTNREPVLRLIEMAAKSIHQAGGWIGICGELAADTELTQKFADMKIDELSVSPPRLLEVRGAVCECK